MTKTKLRSGDQATIPVADFTYQGGERRLVAAIINGKLCLRAMTAKRAACAINLDDDGCHKLIDALNSFLRREGDDHDNP